MMEEEFKDDIDEDISDLDDDIDLGEIGIGEDDFKNDEIDADLSDRYED